jgi:branched-chain amino acid aminotransferase
MLASVDGRIGPAEEATVSVQDDGLRRGDGGFEVMRLYAGRPFAFGEHLARLRATCLGLRLDCDVELVQRECEALLAESGDVDGLLRIILTRGGRRILTVEPLPERSPTARVATVTFAPSRVLDGLKTISYAANMLAGRIAQEQGADEALFVTPHGRVLEGPTWTFFWARDGRLFTPPLTEHILGSITRERLLQCVEVTETPCPRDELALAQEAFIATTVREVMPIVSIDGVGLAAAPGPLTAAAAAAFGAMVERELAAA